MNSTSHHFVTVDMRGLKAALVAHAQAQRMSVSVVVRGAVASALGLAEAERREVPGGKPVVARAPTVKLSIRLTRDEAAAFARGAKTAGLSRGAYLSGLINGVAAVSSGASRTDHVAALVVSSSELATLARDVHHLGTLLRQGSVRAAQVYSDRLESLSDDVRRHLREVALVLSDLQPTRRVADAAPRRNESITKRRSPA